MGLSQPSTYPAEAADLPTGPSATASPVIHRFRTPTRTRSWGRAGQVRMGVDLERDPHVGVPSDGLDGMRRDAHLHWQRDDGVPQVV